MATRGGAFLRADLLFEVLAGVLALVVNSRKCSFLRGGVLRTVLAVALHYFLQISNAGLDLFLGRGVVPARLADVFARSLSLRRAAIHSADFISSILLLLS